MNTDQWLRELEKRMATEKCPPLTVLQKVLVRKVLRDAMQKSWERGNEYDHGMPFSEEML